MSNFHLIDILVIISFFLVIFGIAIYYSKQAGKNTGEFFLSGRNMPWYIAGTAMVATTFAADTPLAVTELIAKNGIAGNWLWWNMAIGGMLTVFFFAKLWRRSGIMTDVEFVEFRYSGKEAAVLRGFRAIYLGLFANAIVMGWVNQAMDTIFSVVIPEVDSFLLVTIAAIIIGIYASGSGLLGTARTDSFQFVFAIVGCIVLAIIVVNLPEVGGVIAMKEKLAPQVLELLPRIGDMTVEGVTGGALAISFGAFIAYVGVQWWASWYPGSDPGGGGYIAQRMMAAKDEKNSLFATLWFTIAHYTLRPWPWILVALAALIIMPRANNVEELRQENPVYLEKAEQVSGNNELLEQYKSTENQEFLTFYEKYENTVNPGVMYPKLMVRYLPTGLFGLLIAVFLSAYMSTMASQLNWGTSYIVNDFYRRFIKKEGNEKHYVLVSRIAIIVMTILSLLVTKYFLTSVSGAWEFIINASAGIGIILILRWFWWRINAWSEISAMIAPLIIYPIAKYSFGLESPITLFPIVIGTTIVWLVVTFITKPTDEEKLIAFYKKTEPGGIGWKHVTDKAGIKLEKKGFGKLFVNWISGIILVYSFLFAIGKIIFAEYFSGTIFLIVSAISSYIIYRNLSETS